MSDDTRSTGEAVRQAAQTVANGVSEAATQAGHAVNQACDGLASFRACVRQQPVTMAFLMLVAGYVLHGLTHPRIR